MCLCVEWRERSCQKLLELLPFLRTSGVNIVSFSNVWVKPGFVISESGWIYPSGLDIHLEEQDEQVKLGTSAYLTCDPCSPISRRAGCATEATQYFPRCICVLPYKSSTDPCRPVYCRPPLPMEMFTGVLRKEVRYSR